MSTIQCVNDGVQLTLSDVVFNLTLDEAKQLLIEWTPHMSSRSNFMCTLQDRYVRSYDVKTAVRLLRKYIPID
jgi:hypothetical protein